MAHRGSQAYSAEWPEKGFHAAGWVGGRQIEPVLWPLNAKEATRGT